MSDWSTIAQLTTAFGTLVLAIATLWEGRWLCSVVRHWNLDRSDPRHD